MGNRQQEDAIREDAQGRQVEAASQSRTQKCVKCDKRSLPGLAPGQGLCRYHWAEGVWGPEWAHKVE